MLRSGWQDQVLHFWFDELTPRDWFVSSPEADLEIAKRFGDVHGALREILPAQVKSDASTALAAIIVLDQFSRNMFRKQAKAFAADPLALSITHNGLEHGLDSEMTSAERQFFYMPLMHSEDIADQEKCVELFDAMGNEGSLKFAIEHRDIIARFGRFPHRNKVLGRSTTPEEISFLEKAESYGQ